MDAITKYPICDECKCSICVENGEFGFNFDCCPCANCIGKDVPEKDDKCIFRPLPFSKVECKNRR